MSVSHVPEQGGIPPPPAPTRSEEAAPTQAGQAAVPPRDADYGARLREVEQLVSASEWQATDGEALHPQFTRERVEELGGARLFPSDPRAGFVLLNEGRYLAIQGVFGVRREQVNLMTAIAALMLAEAARARTERLRSWLPRPTRANVLLADGLLNSFGQQIAGPVARETPFFAALIGAAAVGAVAARVLEHASRDIEAASRRIKLSFRYLLGEQPVRSPRSKHST
jgi:hypothetical protein